MALADGGYHSVTDVERREPADHFHDIRQSQPVLIENGEPAVVQLASGTNTPTLTVTIDSDSAENFGASPETQLTFVAKTAVGSGWQVAGPAAITDDWWRAEWTISGDTPSFVFVVSFGIWG